MQRTTLTAIITTAFLAGGTASFANDTMSEEQCLKVIMAVSKLEISMAGLAPFDEALAGLDKVRPTIPADVTPEIDNLVSLAKATQDIEPGDPAHPMATGTFQEASLSYQKALAPYCPDYNLEY